LACSLQVIKEVREITKLDLKAAKDLVEAAPKVLVKDLKKEEAEALMKKLKEAGATCELEVLVDAVHNALVFIWSPACVFAHVGLTLIVYVVCGVVIFGVCGTQ